MDYTLGDTVYLMFTTRSFSTGAPTTLAGVPVVSAYEDDSITQITAGITLGVDHDTVTGLNLLTIVASGANGFEAGKQYNLVITTGTVGGVSVVGEVVGTFSLEAEAAFTRLGAPAGASIAADIAGVQADTDDIQARLPAALVGGRMASIAEVIGTDAVDAAALAADALAEINTEVDAALADVNLDHLVGTATAIPAVPAGTYLDQIMDDGTAVFDRTTDSLQAIRDTAPLGTAMRGTDDAALAAVCTEARLAELDAANLPTDAANIEADTQNIQSRLPAALVSGRIDASVGAMATDVLDGAALAASAVDEIWDEVFAELTGVPGATPTGRQAIMRLYMAARNLRETTASEDRIFNDAGTAVIEADVADDGTTFSKSKDRAVTP